MAQSPCQNSSGFFIQRGPLQHGGSARLRAVFDLEGEFQHIAEALAGIDRDGFRDGAVEPGRRSGGARLARRLCRARPAKGSISP